MAKKMLIDATHAEETRVVVVDGNKVEEFDFESENKRQLAGNIYLAKVTRVEPSLQAAFVDYGGNRHGFLAFSEVHPDYYQIPVADREALLAEEAAEAEAEREEEETSKRRTRSRSRSKPAEARSDDGVTSAEPDEAADDAENGEEADANDGDLQATARTAAVIDAIPGMDVVDLVEDDPRPDAAAREAVDAVESDESIESVADDDVEDEVRRPRKPRAKKYKIQEVIKVRQILLVQVVKEERGNKGAALTTYLSLAGRYCVLMPNTARGGGISRKITNAADRKKLKEIASSIDVPRGAGLIVRTAGAKRTKTEIRRDYEYLQRMWEQIRALTLRSIAPAPIYEEGNLIKRSIRDLYNREIDEVLVEGEGGYRTAKDFMKMIMPSHAKNVKNYHDQMPLFARHQVETYLNGMFNPTVQLKSGGYIVIGVTEALVAIDVNSGRATKEGSVEETAYKTNLEAAEEVARQLRLRDLAGLIVIDFIDMEDRKHNASVEKHFKDKLKTDRARIQVGKISGFGLLEMSRQRLRPGMIEATTQPCSHCHGTGLLRSDDNVSLSILRQLEEEGTRKRSREVLVICPVAICNYLMNHKRDHIALIEARYGMAVRVEADSGMVSPDYKVEKFKTQSTRVVEQSAAIVSSSAMMEEIDADEVEQEVDETEAPPAAESLPSEPDHDAGADTEDSARTDEEKPKKRRRRRRRRKSGGENGGQSDESRSADGDDAQASDEDGEGHATRDAEQDDDAAPPKRKRSRSRSRKSDGGAPETSSEPRETETASGDTPDATVEESPAPAEPVVEETASAPPAETTEEVADRPVPEDISDAITRDVPIAPPAPETEAEAPEERRDPEPANAEGAPDADHKPKRRGWWSLRG
ncbi:RNAse E [Palleronia aestuarii]|uniref:Ribonuclease E n=1 Tax=Palleronia aestuarii TaxID=568105 RepID=A0A2W7PVP8_9RHOB|nr:ribonuclease E/G [Palleronia aestuarii]PZX13629.1 RNAse E [Palleronia aestuarii]